MWIWRLFLEKSFWNSLSEWFNWSSIFNRLLNMNGVDLCSCCTRKRIWITISVYEKQREMPQVFSHLSDRGLACLFKPTSQVHSREFSVRIFKPYFCYQNSNANIRVFFTRVEERLKFTYIFSFNRYYAGFPQNKVICSKMIKNHSWNIKFNHFRLKIVFQNRKR